MRTKTLLLIAAAAVAGMVSSQAQVYSVNAVGYVNKKVPAKGFALVSNPLTATTNTIEALLGGQVPDGAQVFVWDTTSGAYQIASFSTDFGWDYSVASLATKEIKPGSGFFIKNPTAAEITVTFVGEVPQGTLTTTLVPGFQIVSSQVPQAGTPTALGYVADGGDKIYQWNTTTQGYVPAQFDPEFGWSPEPTALDVGDAFFLSKTKTGTWTRTFSVNTQ